MSKVNNEIRRDALLKFYAYMTDRDVKEVEAEYLGKTDDPNWTNKLYMGVETTVALLSHPITKEEGK